MSNTLRRERRLRGAGCKARSWASTRSETVLTRLFGQLLIDKVDIAMVWGPLAGYFAKEFGHDLRVTPVEPEVDPPGLPFTFAISMGVRKGNVALRDQLEKVLLDRGSDIRAILDEYGVPQLPLASLVSVAWSGAR